MKRTSGHSTSEKRTALTSFKPQGTRRPTLTHIGGVVLFSDGTKDVGRSTKPMKGGG